VIEYEAGKKKTGMILLVSENGVGKKGGGFERREDHSGNLITSSKEE